jgi:hypothetical protein
LFLLRKTDRADANTPAQKSALMNQLRYKAVEQTTLSSP